ncbi:sperm flagellar protein 2 isoform X2 [Neopsephotus bourkii]|uniref:sperm flagellar protein 2 isoform X2 n=1 Tax=Neopsephotus bourkii TaxID=309878 RepID=UPI002AA5802A|nr:sperm flagellar protein 2 isoform X2 [Neopsephotus bourkii]
MSGILCEWLNEEVQLSRSLVPGSISEEFSNGYLLGELLHKYDLQDDFDQFSQSRVAIAKLNNFSRLEPTLHLLGVQFNENVAQNIMTGQHGAATKLLYELYIALEKKRKTKLTRVAMEAMTPAATVKLKSIESILYRERLKTLTPRQFDLQLQQIAEQFEKKSKAAEDKIACKHIAEQQKIQKLQEERKTQDIEKHHVGRKRQNEIMARIQEAILQTPKPPPSHTIKAIEAKKFLRKKREAEDAYKEISKFEKSIAYALHSQITDSDIEESLQAQKLQETIPETTEQTASELLSVYSDDDYVRKIKKRLEEDTFSREQREKRRRKMLMDQLIAHEAEEKAYREEQLIYRLLRQTQQERRIAVQLMHVRHEKEVLRQNRIFREKEYKERRLKEFQEALDREEALAKQEKIDYEEQIIKEREHHEKIAAERAQARYKKHYSICWEVVNQIIDLSTQVGKYRLLTNNRIPLKLMLDWKELFFKGKLIYKQASIQPMPSEPHPEQLLHLNKLNLLDEKDFSEYKNMTGEWCPDEENFENRPPLNNNMLGHVLHRLKEIFCPPKPISSPAFPPFPIKGCILGKPFSGKTTCVKFIEKVCNIQVLSVDILVQEAIQAFLKNEMKSEENMIPQEAESSGEENEKNLPPLDVLKNLETEISINGTEGNFPVRKDPSWQEIKPDDSQDDLSKLSVRAQLGAASQKLLKKGESIPDELLIDILLEAIKQIPPEKGWILDGFPMTINQAKLFEKAYTGIDPEAEDANSVKFSLVIDPRAPNKPPATSPAFDISVLLDTSDTVILERVANLKYKSKLSQTEQENRNQNPDAVSPEKIDFSRDKVLHRISGFLDTWPKLEKWFSVHHNILVKINAETEEKLVCETVKEIIIEEIFNKQNRRCAKEISPEKKISPVDVSNTDTHTQEDLLPPILVEPPPIEPGSDEWIYVDEPLPKEIPGFLVPYWEMVENTYMNTIKSILRCLRDEQHSVIYYLADVRKKFQDYLKHPDIKQEFVSVWQSDFNSVADDLREDEQAKAELHQRVTDLRDLLWDICDNRREEAEQERTDIMNDGWLPDHRGIAVNHFLSLMQVEVDRFQDTKRILHDYYRAMEGKIPAEYSQDFTRIPLLDIMDSEQKEDQNNSRRIPLVSWKVPIPEIFITKSKPKGSLQKSPKNDNSENGVATVRKDESLITDTWQTAATTVSNMVTAETQFRETEEEEEGQQLNLKSSKPSSKATKDSKMQSPKKASKKKGLSSTASMGEDSTVPINPEELKKQEMALKIKQEYFSALKHEEAAIKFRLELIKEKALAFVEELTMKAEEAYKEMEEWLGSRFLAEMSSVEKLVEVARHHIESSSKIQYEIILEETDFFISSDVKVFPDPVPSPHVPHMETSGSSTLTMSQLTALHKQFLQVAPKAIKALKQFKRKSNSSSKREVGDRGKEKKDLEHQRTKRNLHFPKIWLTKYSWLKYDGERGIMFCAPCRKHNVDLGENIHNFCSGTDDFKLEFINTHQSSEAHAWATCMEAATTASPHTDSAEQMLKCMNSITLGRVENIFRTCHAIAKSGHPFTDLDWMCKLDDMKGVDIGSVFRNDKSARMFIHFIAEVERRALKEKLEKCKFFSVISDGVTDSILKKAAVVYVRFANEGKVHCQIVGVQPVHKTDASTIKNAIEQTLQINLQLSLASQDWSRKLVGFGSDGTGVMVGENSGVAKLLREIQPCILSLRCFAHHLNLVYKEVLENVQLYNILISLLRNMYYFYHNSPLNKNNLKATYEAIKLRPAIPSRIGGSQWLPRLQTALQILLKGYPAIVLHLNKIERDSTASNQQKVKGLLHLLLKMEIVKFSHFLLDVINVLNILSCVTLDHNSSIADIFATVQLTLETLHMYQTRAGPKERLMETLQLFHGYQLIGNGNISAVRTKVLHGLVNRLRDCFCDASQDVLRATTIGSFKLWPSKMKQGFIQKKEFIDAFIDMINLNLGANCLPDAWMNLTLPRLQNLASAFSVNSELTDWRRFLLAAAQPWPVPSVTQLLETLHSFKSLDVAGSGFVTQEHYMQVGLWFNGNEDVSITESCTEPLPLDRLRELIKFFFSLFADTKKDPALLSYTEMLLYFASHSDPVEGVYRALSIATGTYIHRKEDSLPYVAFPYINIDKDEETLIEEEKEVLNYMGEGIISMETLLKVFRTGGSKDDDNNRFCNPEKEGSYDKHFIRMYKDLGSKDLTPIPVAVFLKHSFIQDLINSYQEYKLPDINIFFQRSEEAQSSNGKNIINVWRNDLHEY